MYGTLDFDYEKYNNNWTPIMEVIENISILIKQKENKILWHIK